MKVDLKELYDVLKPCSRKRLTSSLEFLTFLSTGKAEDMTLEELRTRFKRCETKVDYYYMNEDMLPMYDPVDRAYQSSPGCYGRRIL